MLCFSTWFVPPIGALSPPAGRSVLGGCACQVSVHSTQQIRLEAQCSWLAKAERVPSGISLELGSAPRDCGQWLLASTLDRNEVPVCGLFLAPLSKTRFRHVCVFQEFPDDHSRFGVSDLHIFLNLWIFGDALKVFEGYRKAKHV